MPSRKDEFGPDNFYHVFNRGASKQPIFANRLNYRHLLRLLKRYASQKQVEIVCYCLMPNHFHLLLHQQTDKPISDFMGTVFNAYVQAFNRQQARTGTLFEGRFKHVLINKSDYPIQLMQYIHVNPVVANIVTEPETWDFCDYRQWAGLGCGLSANLHDKPSSLERFRNALCIPEPEEYRQSVMQYLKFQRDEARFKKYMLD